MAPNRIRRRASTNPGHQASGPAMDAHGIARLAVISAVPAGPRAGQPFLQRHVAIPVLQRLFGATYDDMRRMEALLRGSDLDWICLRPRGWSPRRPPAATA